jgi:hypothetical protein
MTATIAFEQNVAADVRDVQVGDAVVVEIAGSNTHPITDGVRAAARCDVVERPVAAVPVEAMPGQLTGGGEQIAALHEIQIEIAVVVHVEQRDAATHDFREVELLCVPGAMREGDPRALGDVFEPGGAGWISRAGRRRLA